jgi:hypothetical protein
MSGLDSPVAMGYFAEHFLSATESARPIRYGRSIILEANYGDPSKVGD